MERDIWGVFHDGSVTLIDGEVPGTLRLELELEYLRKMFAEPGSSFRIELRGCSRFVYNDYEHGAESDLRKIQDREPEILYVSSEHPLSIGCVEGVIEMEYAQMLVFLPSGAPVGYNDLIGANERYWSEWGKRAEGNA